MTDGAAGRPPGGRSWRTLATVTRRAIPLIATWAAVLLTTSAAPGTAGHREPSGTTDATSAVRGASSFRSDGWIKLCGLSTG